MALILPSLTCNWETSAGPVAGSSAVPSQVRITGSSDSTLPPAANDLHLVGPVTTDSRHEIVGSGRGCGFGPPFLFQTNAMVLPGTAGSVAGVSFSIPASPSSAGSYDAATPTEQYGYTPLTLGLGASATAGAGNRINAASGKIAVMFASATQGLFYGSFDATFVDGTRLSGVWVYRVGQ
jgi:hypothetical protein